MRDESTHVCDCSKVDGRLRIAYVAERVVTLMMVIGVCLRAHRMIRVPTYVASGTVAGGAALAAIAGLTIVRMAAPLWLWALLPRQESVRAGRRWQVDALESVALATCGLAFGISYLTGFTVTACVAALWFMGRRIGRDPVDETPFASCGASMPDAAVTVAERAEFPPENIVVDELTHPAAQTISYHKRPFILLAPHVLENYNDREVAVVVAHELAHVKLHDLARARVYRILLCVATIAAMAGSIQMAGAAQPGTPIAANPVALTTGVLALGVMELLCVPVMGWLSRRIERRANRWALAKTGDIDAFISAMTKLHSGLGSPPEPAWWSQLLAHEHPSLRDALTDAQRAYGRRPPDAELARPREAGANQTHDPVLPSTR